MKQRGLLAIAGNYGVVVQVEPADNRTPWKTGVVWAWCPNLETIPGPTLPVLEIPQVNPHTCYSLVVVASNQGGPKDQLQPVATSLVRVVQPECQNVHFSHFFDVFDFL